VLGVDGSYPQVCYRNLDDGTVVNYNCDGVGGQQFAKQGPGFTQYPNVFKFYDTGLTNGANPLSEFDLFGGPNNSAGLGYGPYGMSNNWTLDSLGNEVNNTLNTNIVGGTGGRAGVLCLQGNGEQYGCPTWAVNQPAAIRIFGGTYSGISGASGQIYLGGDDNYNGILLDNGGGGGHVGAGGFGFQPGDAINLPTNFNFAFAYGTVFGYIPHGSTYYIDKDGNANLAAITGTSVTDSGLISGNCVQAHCSILCR
jgi:hypothetical protein